MHRQRLALFFGGLLCVVLLAGCAGTRSVDQRSVELDLLNSNFNAYAMKYIDAKGQTTYDKENLLDTLEAGKAFNDAGMWEKSKVAFSYASTMMMWKATTTTTPSSIVSTIGTTLTNDTFGPYVGNIFQGGMIDYYQAINSLMMSDEASARVNFNRVSVRQSNAVTQLESFLETNNQAITRAEGSTAVNSTQRSLSAISPQLALGMQAVPTGLSKSKIRNAAADFMSAVFRSTSSSAIDKAGGLPRDLLRQAGSSAATQGGLELIRLLDKDLQQGQGVLSNKVIVLYEDGVGPSFSEFRIDLPLFIVSNRVMYSGIALPKFQLGRPALDGLTLGPTRVPTAVMTNMNDLAGLEFEAAYQGIVAKAVISTIIKTSAQYAVNSAIDSNAGNSLLGLLLKLGTGATQAALTRADTRAWINLPNTIQIGYLNRPASGTLLMMGISGRPLGEIILPPSPNTLLLVKASGPGGQPAVFIQNLPLINATAGL